MSSDVTYLITEGGRYGIRVIATAEAWRHVPDDIAAKFGTAWESRLTDPGESRIDPYEAARAPVGAPGRGLTSDGYVTSKRPAPS